MAAKENIEGGSEAVIPVVNDVYRWAESWLSNICLADRKLGRYTELCGIHESPASVSRLQVSPNAYSSQWRWWRQAS